MLRLRTLGWLLLAALFFAAPVSAQDDEAPPKVEASLSDDVEPVVEPVNEDRGIDHWWLGAYFRHLEIPGYMLDAFLDRAPAIANNGFGLVGTYRTGDGLNIEMGIGYMPFEFDGPLLAPGSPITDTELAHSDLGFVHLTGSVLWDIKLHKVFAFEVGVGLDLGLFTGDMVRNEAFRDDNGDFQDCPGPVAPGLVAPPMGTANGPTGFANGQFYCNNQMITTDSSDEGEHYNVKEDAVPPIFALPMLPRVGIRIEPVDFLAIKAEAAFGIVSWWVGASLHFKLGALVPQHGSQPEEPVAVAEASVGRVLGRVVEMDSGVPVAGATVTLKARALSPLQTMDDGRFIVDRLDPGEVTFEIEREGYVAGTCEVTITDKGGDVPVVCKLSPLAQVGALSGQVKTEKGKPIGGATIEIEGPKTARVTSADDGSFGAVDLPAGTYRLHVDAEEYLMQVLEIEIEPQDTAMPKVILIKKPKRSLVTLSNKEIVISQQVRFETNSAEIVASSDPLLREIADVMLRNTQVQLVEIQGHTDNTGAHDHNMTLSQERAEAVKAWLVNAGVAENRLEAKGYGPDHPLGPNKTAADKAKNRRVQLIILKQSAEVAEEPEEE